MRRTRSRAGASRDDPKQEPRTEHFQGRLHWGGLLLRAGSTG